MLKRLFLVALMASPVIALEARGETIFNFPKETKKEIRQIFYGFAVNQYNNANYGDAKGLLERLSRDNNDFPGASFFLAKIYLEVPLFKNIVLSKQYFLKVITTPESNSIYKQKAYLALIDLTTDSDVKLSFAREAFKIGQTKETKDALIVAYQLKYDETQDSQYMHGANIVMKSLDKRERVRFTDEVKAINTGLSVKK